MCVWDTEELHEYISMAFDEFNANKPITNFDSRSIADIPDKYKRAVLYRAICFAATSVIFNFNHSTVQEQIRSDIKTYWKCFEVRSRYLGKFYKLTQDKKGA